MIWRQARAVGRGAPGRAGSEDDVGLAIQAATLRRALSTSENLGSLAQRTQDDLRRTLPNHFSAPARAVLDDGLKQLGGICDALAAQLAQAAGLAETRKRSDSQGTAFPGPGRALENARRLADRME